jgi:hypothetical protein
MLETSATCSVGRWDFPAFVDNAARRTNSARISCRVPHTSLVKAHGSLCGGVMSWRGRLGTTRAHRRAARARSAACANSAQNGKRQHSGRNDPTEVTGWRCEKRGGAYVTWRTRGLDCGVVTEWSVRPTGSVFPNSNMKQDSPPSSTAAQEHTGNTSAITWKEPNHPPRPPRRNGPEGRT